MNNIIDKSKWQLILNEIRDNVSEVSFRTWFKDIIPVKSEHGDSNTLTLACADSFKIEILSARYVDVIEKASAKIASRPIKVIFKSVSEDEIEGLANSDTAKIIKSSNQPEEDKNPYKKEYYLNPTYNFDNFVVGPNNTYAHAVSLAVAESPAQKYNPLFLYGESGLGKTHLMHSIGHYILKKNPESKVLYVSTEMFTNELIDSLRETGGRKDRNKINNFKKKYRDVDVLLIDDIQFIGGKESTQNEFFHTFETLYSLNKQIVICSDKHPSQLQDIDDRLRTRFQWNIVADIQSPELETRVAILRKKAEEKGVHIDDDVSAVIDLIAEKVKDNIRQLESALNRIISLSAVFGEKITPKFAKEKLTDIFSAKDQEISCETIKKAVCRKYNVKIIDIESSKRNREITTPRQIAMYLCRELTEFSYPKIGKAFGGRDHTTVLHACEKISKDLKTNSVLAEEIKELKEEIQ